MRRLILPAVLIAVFLGGCDSLHKGAPRFQIASEPPSEKDEGFEPAHFPTPGCAVQVFVAQTGGLAINNEPLRARNCRPDTSTSNVVYFQLSNNAKRYSFDASDAITFKPGQNPPRIDCRQFGKSGRQLMCIIAASPTGSFRYNITVKKEDADPIVLDPTMIN